MKKLFVMFPLVAVLSACGTTDPYGRIAEMQQKQSHTNVQSSIDQAPEWMIKLPKSSSAIYQNGTAVSYDMAMADEKAVDIASGKICSTANGTTSKDSRVFLLDSTNATSESSQLAIKNSCKNVDISGLEIVDIKHVAEGGRFRSYVLVALPTGDANIIKKAHQRQDQDEQALELSGQTFKSMQ